MSTEEQRDFWRNRLITANKAMDRIAEERDRYRLERDYAKGRAMKAESDIREVVAAREERTELLRPFADGVVGPEDDTDRAEVWPDHVQLRLSVRAEHVHAARAALQSEKERGA